MLVRRRRHRAGSAADHEHARAVDGGAGAAPGLGLDEQELLRAELELLAVELEEGAAGEDDVQLLVTVRAEAGLVVGADEHVARTHGAVGADAEARRAERASDGMPDVVSDLRLREVGESNVAGTAPALELGHCESPDLDGIGAPVKGRAEPSQPDVSRGRGRRGAARRERNGTSQLTSSGRARDRASEGYTGTERA